MNRSPIPQRRSKCGRNRQDVHLKNDPLGRVPHPRQPIRILPRQRRRNDLLDRGLSVRVLRIGQTMTPRRMIRERNRSRTLRSRRRKTSTQWGPPASLRAPRFESNLPLARTFPQRKRELDRGTRNRSRPNCRKPRYRTLQSLKPPSLELRKPNLRLRDLKYPKHPNLRSGPHCRGRQEVRPIRVLRLASRERCDRSWPVTRTLPVVRRLKLPRTLDWIFMHPDSTW